MSFTRCNNPQCDEEIHVIGDHVSGYWEVGHDSECPDFERKTRVTHQQVQREDDDSD